MYNSFTVPHSFTAPVIKCQVNMAVARDVVEHGKLEKESHIYTDHVLYTLTNFFVKGEIEDPEKLEEKYVYAEVPSSWFQYLKMELSNYVEYKVKAINLRTKLTNFLTYKNSWKLVKAKVQTKTTYRICHHLVDKDYKDSDRDWHMYFLFPSKYENSIGQS